MDRVQGVSILGSAGLLGVVLELVRSRRLREQYSLLWIFTALVLLILSSSRHLLDRLAHLIGIKYPPSALFTVAIGFGIVILLHFSVVHSRLSREVKTLTQEIALLKDRRRAASGE